ncbi:MAG: septal ring lytic transglycosylase RlpA family protein [Candidatus Peregrinibacteria bacterium]
MRQIPVILTILLFPCAIFASSAGVTRRDGFLFLWSGIARPTMQSSEKAFTDVPKGSAGFVEITYAKYRGIVDDDPAFRPDAELSLQDALLWLFRTRSVDDIDLIKPENLPDLLTRYQIAYPSADFTQPVKSMDELTSLSQSLDSFLVNEVHEVSLYSEKFHGKGTAFGETFDMNALTAAHRTFPGNTLVEVTNVANGKSVTVRINDRGPYVKGRDMDLSLAAFVSISPREAGVIHATFKRLGDATLVNTCSPELRRYQKRLTKDFRFDKGIPHSQPVGEQLTLSSTKSFVVRSITYPDGSIESLQNWILPEETFSITPSITGKYVFHIDTAKGYGRDFVMEAEECGKGG